MKTNHDFITALFELYQQLPEDCAEFAAKRVAVLVEMELEELDAKGETITIEALLEKFKAAIEQHKKFAA